MHGAEQGNGDTDCVAVRPFSEAWDWLLRAEDRREKATLARIGVRLRAGGRVSLSSLASYVPR